ncbi:hypothetical protein BH10BAC5_BH10BAC5_27560 [soil metagenome]
MEKSIEIETVLFSDLNLSAPVMKAIADLGFEQPTPIQALSIPVLMEGRDVLGQAQTGTGKTASFGIPLIEKITAASKIPQALIMCPTRELAIQVTEDLVHLAKYRKEIKILSIYGGQDITRQIRSLASGVSIVCGTPGRIQDHLDRGTLKLQEVKTVILDEADEMLNMGFRDAIEKILNNIKEKHQTVLFSATMAPPIMKLTKKYLVDPVEVKIVHKDLTVPGIEQFYYEIREKDKLNLLCSLLDIHQYKLSLVFCNTKRGVDDLVEHLNARGYIADALHGDMRQQQRDKVMNKFRNQKLDILVATDVAARGLDVNDIDAVFNYDFAQDEEYYVHRIGRTGRAGKKGCSYSFVTAKEIYKLKDIKKYTNAKIMRMEIPTVTDVETAKSNKFSERIRKEIKSEQLGKYIKMIEEMVNDDITLSELSAALLKIVYDSERASSPVVSESSSREGRRSFDRGNDRGNDRGGRSGGDRGGRSSDRGGRSGGDRGGRSSDRGGNRSKSSYSSESKPDYKKDFAKKDFGTEHVNEFINSYSQDREKPRSSDKPAAKTGFKRSSSGVSGSFKKSYGKFDPPRKKRY